MIVYLPEDFPVEEVLRLASSKGYKAKINKEVGTCSFLKSDLPTENAMDAWRNVQPSSKKQITNAIAEGIKQSELGESTKAALLSVVKNESGARAR